MCERYRGFGKHIYNHNKGLAWFEVNMDFPKGAYKRVISFPAAKPTGKVIPGWLLAKIKRRQYLEHLEELEWCNGKVEPALPIGETGKAVDYQAIDWPVNGWLQTVMARKDKV